MGQPVRNWHLEIGDWIFNLGHGKTPEEFSLPHLRKRADPPDYSNNPKYGIIPRSLVDAGRPYVLFSSLEQNLNTDGTLTLVWETANAATCSASGSWSGPKSELGGMEVVGPVSGDAVFQLTCSNNSGETVRTVALNQGSGTGGAGGTGGASGTGSTGNTGGTGGGGGALSPLAGSILFIMSLLLIRRNCLHPRRA